MPPSSLSLALPRFMPGQFSTDLDASAHALVKCVHCALQRIKPSTPNICLITVISDVNSSLAHSRRIITYKNLCADRAPPFFYRLSSSVSTRWLLFSRWSFTFDLPVSPNNHRSSLNFVCFDYSAKVAPLTARTWFWIWIFSTAISFFARHYLQMRLSNCCQSWY